MKVLLASEFRCNVYNGEYYLLPKAYYIYKRYADIFGKLIVCSRLEEVDELSGGMLKVDFIDSIIDIRSLHKVLIGKYDNTINCETKKCDLVICRFPSMIAYKAAKFAKENNVPYIAELMCDGWDSYWNHGISGKIIAPYMHYTMKERTRNASYAIYVTEKYLQLRYPCTCPSIHASNVVLKNANPVVLLNRIDAIDNIDKNHIKIMTTADVDVISKGHRYVVEALKLLKDKGIIVDYYLVGAGNQENLMRLATKLGVEKQMFFKGRLGPSQVIECLDKIDIYVHPSLQEGLPRAVIEAMNRACPCLGARTAGIPELLDKECVFERKSAIDIVKSIEWMLESDIKKYAINNFEKSKAFLEDILDDRRNTFFKMIKGNL